jgi:hypothetical protein
MCYCIVVLRISLFGRALSRHGSNSHGHFCDIIIVVVLYPGHPTHGIGTSNSAQSDERSHPLHTTHVDSASRNGPYSSPTARQVASLLEGVHAKIVIAIHMPPYPSNCRPLNHFIKPQFRLS